jgi:peptide/nickel transport system permease protein
MKKNADTTTLITQKYKKRSYFGNIFHSLKQNKGAMVAFVIIAIMILTFLASLTIDFATVTLSDTAHRFEPPSSEFPFGTDNFGRNLFLRVVYGTRYSLVIGVGVVVIALVFGTVLGAISGFYGGKVDDIIMRANDVLASIPGMLLGMVIMTSLGQNLQNLIIAIGVTSIPVYLRITRATVLSVRNQEFVEAARAIGISDFRIIFTQVLPNCMSPVIVTVTTSLGLAIILAAGMSFIGFGVPVPHPEWGGLISAGREYVRTAPWIMTFPGIAIMLIVLAFNLLGDGLRDALDPKLKK